ncbi:hypothetical protein CK203_006483 [Vitis vinifera]|uniref:Uncharacterized protein n=1 Tax=Vitis vinifera TaxID=29760 RepID=A0A438KBB1_VITVI|nr:hypothetical protein CK203_006483 [Vitis vinifera]
MSLQTFNLSIVFCILSCHAFLEVIVSSGLVVSPPMTHNPPHFASNMAKSLFTPLCDLRKMVKLTQSAGLLSYSFLRQTGHDRIVVPMVSSHCSTYFSWIVDYADS